MIVEWISAIAVIVVLVWGLVSFWKDWRKRTMYEVPLTGGWSDAPEVARRRSGVAKRRGVSGKAKTSIFLVVVVAAMIGWEALALTVIGPGATISEVYWSARKAFPLDLLVGVLIGHLTWQSRAAHK